MTTPMRPRKCDVCGEPKENVALWMNKQVCPKCYLAEWEAHRKPEMNFVYLHDKNIGYGNHGTETHNALTDLGIDVYDGLPGSGDEDLDKKNSKVCRDVVYLTAPSHVPGWWDGQRKHLFTMWETDTLPELMRVGLENFDTILTPSQECVELYSQYHDNVKYVPLGIDPKRWQRRERRKPDVFFTFLVGGSGPRKGTDLVYRAFNELFPNGTPIGDGPIPRLIFKSPRGEEYRGEGIECINGFMSPEEEVELYASAHCYVQPARGEGWGLQPLQAMAQGCPTILTDAHGHAPFAKHGLPIPATKTDAIEMDTFGESGQWWEPDYRRLVKWMRDVYESYEFHTAYAWLNAAEIHQRFTWANSAKALVDAIGGVDMLRERWSSITRDRVFVTPHQETFRVVTLKNWRADIGGTVHYFEKGKEYRLPADTKRVLFEVSVLDPSCLGDDEGLSPSQLERRGEYIANLKQKTEDT